jgi:hypothetical protein
MLTFAIAALTLQTPADIRQTTLATPQTIVVIDQGQVKGTPAKLAWSPDGRELYLQMAERDGAGNVKSTKQYVVSVGQKTMKAVDKEPDWVAKYWTWKSAQASPDAPAFKIEVDQRQETVRATSAPTGGAMAKGAVTDPTAGTTASDMASASLQSQKQVIFTLRAKGETIGEWTNEAVVPGVNFGWAPAPAHVLAFTKRTGGPIMLLDDQGHKKELTGAKDATLPAWSDDGAHMAWIERQDRRHLAVTIADVNAK